MYTFPASPIHCGTSLWRHRSLIVALTRREVMGRYRGSVMGILWSFFHPVLMLGVYTFVFGIVFKARWNAGSESRVEFALVLFAGMLIFNLFAECINRAPVLVLAHTNYVRKIVFPLEILPWVSLGSALFHLVAGLSMWIGFHLVFFGLPKPSLLLLPLVMLPLLLVTLGLSWMLAALGVYLRDLSQIVGVATTALMFLSPVFYPVTSLPAEYRFILHLNPLTPALEQARAVMIWGHNPFDTLFALHAVAGALIACLGFAWFQKTRKGFADVL